MDKFLKLLFIIFIGIFTITGSGGGGDGDGDDDESDGSNTNSTTVQQWTWMAGSDTVDESGIYGTKLTAAASNVPGAREGSMSWIDSSSNLWLFGGYGFDIDGTLEDLNDLWLFNQTSGQWTWVAGSDTYGQAGAYGDQGATGSSYYPGARDSGASWIDSDGFMWLFGGYGYGEDGETIGNLNDLWKYNSTTKEWTWVSGSNEVNQAGTYGEKEEPDSSNTPGARWYCVSWTDSSGNLWLFGGNGLGASDSSYGELNDLWKFDGTMWTWVSGSSEVNHAGTYGTKGTAAATNMPGARDSCASWIDSSGDLWIFGGYGYDANSASGRLNDLWKFDTSAGQWTWVSGSSEISQVGTYGTKGTAAAANVPGARMGSISWIDSSGNLWLFGGQQGYNTSSVSLTFNDLWRYSPSSGQWTWISGSNEINQEGTYGTLKTQSASNVPGARYYGMSWVDSSDNLWLFGGYGLEDEDDSTFGDFNDLWRFIP